MFLLLVPATAGAEIYKYTDENGCVMLTDTPRVGRVAEVIRDSKPTLALNKAPRASNVHQIIADKADKYRLDPTLVSAVITAESAFNPNAVSHKGAMGLMQLMPGTARDMGVANPFSPEENIEGGAKYLKYLVDKFDGDLTRALAAYNAGPERVKSSSRLPRETENYIKKVYSLYRGDRRVPTLAPEDETVIYKIVLDSGQVLYTNTLPTAKKTIQRL